MKKLAVGESDFKDWPLFSAVKTCLSKRKSKQNQMKSLENQKRLPAQKSFAASIIITFLFVLVMFFGVFGQGAFTNLKSRLIAGTVLAYFAFLLFMMLYTGNINRWRKVFFTTYAVFFAVGFIWYTVALFRHYKSLTYFREANGRPG